VIFPFNILNIAGSLHQPVSFSQGNIDYLLKLITQKSLTDKWNCGSFNAPSGRLILRHGF
jgi:hypothetical protein